MYAVFQSGGKQHRVSEGQTLRLEKLDVETGTQHFNHIGHHHGVIFDRLLC